MIKDHLMSNVLKSLFSRNNSNMFRNVLIFFVEFWRCNIHRVLWSSDMFYMNQNCAWDNVLNV